MRLEYLPYALPLFAATLIALALIGYSWQKRTIPIVYPFMATCLTISIWSFVNALHTLTYDASLRFTFGKLMNIGIVYLPVAWATFGIVYSGRERWITPRRIFLALIFPTITLSLVFTNDLHRLMFSQQTIDYSGVIPRDDNVWGGWFWLHSLYCYVALLLGSGMMIAQGLRRNTFFMSRMVLNVTAALIPMVANLIFILQVVVLPVDPTSFAFGIGLSLLAWNVFRFEMLSMLPVAYQSIVDQMPDSVFVIDTQNRLLELNPSAEKLFGRQNQTVIGQPLIQVFPRFRTAVEQIVAMDEGRLEFQLEVSGAVRWFEVVIAPVDRKVARGKLGIVRDITLRKQDELEVARARDAAVEASQFKTQLISKVTHDLRTPLTAIRGYADLIHMDLVDGLPSDEHVELLDKLIFNTIYLEGMISTLLEQAKLDAGQITLNQTFFNPEEICFTVRHSLEVMATSKGLQLIIQVDEKLPSRMWGASERIIQVLQNLINNAIKFTLKGQVKATLYPVDQTQWAIEVSDTGIGIPTDKQKVIFEAFHQLDAPEAPSRAGAGLGLSIVKELVELMNGTIVVNSQPGIGSTFTVYLPLQEVPAIDLPEGVQP